MAKQLVVIAGPDKGKVFGLFEGSSTLLGRSRHADTKLNDLRVSRVHCEVELEDGQAVLTDLDSVGGTLVNGKAVSERVLQAGDVIQIGDTQLRLRAEADAGGETPAPSAPGPALTAETLAELTGKAYSHFQVGPVLAKGQSGLVFRARNFKDDQEVALKVFWPQSSQNGPEMRRFIRSVKTMLPLRHPNLVTLYAAGKTGPCAWIAMELIEGESLTQVIQRIGVGGMLDWRYALRVAVHVARALDFAHRRQVIHRNITPQNVMVRTADKATKVGDLTLAKAMEGTQAEQITRPGELVGDLRYMSPERTGGTADVGGRSDLYSLGALVYALLTGRPPFEGTSLVETITKIRKEEPIKPKKFQMSISDQFEGTVLKLLAKRPEDRYQTAADLLKDLERVAKLQGVAL